MLKVIPSELRKLENQKYTGQIKFGIEYGVVTSIVISPKIESLNNLEPLNIFNEMFKHVANIQDISGNIIFIFDFGKIISNSYNMTFKGEALRRKIRND